MTYNTKINIFIVVIQHIEKPAEVKRGEWNIKGG